MILIVTSNKQGGILQFACRIVKELEDLEEECYLIVTPDCDEEIKGVKNCKVFSITRSQYFKKKNINKFCTFLDSMKPEMILFADDSILSLHTLSMYSGRGKTAIAVHDVKRHMQTTIMRSTIVDILRYSMRKKSFKRADKIVVMSRNSQKLFGEKYRAFANKSFLLPLGSHIPLANQKKPEELTIFSGGFFLFFGRVDKYKGIDTLINAYSRYVSVHEGKNSLIIAGKDISTNNSMSAPISGIFRLNRFINNEEMMWLFCNCSCLILPYKEASQSGVLPIAYELGKPVIVSSCLGLAEYVEEGKTGFVCDSPHNYASAMKKMEDEKLLDRMGANCVEYYKENLDWRTNIKRLINCFK